MVRSWRRHIAGAGNFLPAGLSRVLAINTEPVHVIDGLDFLGAIIVDHGILWLPPTEHVQKRVPVGKLHHSLSVTQAWRRGIAGFHFGPRQRFVVTRGEVKNPERVIDDRRTVPEMGIRGTTLSAKEIDFATVARDFHTTTGARCIVGSDRLPVPTRLYRRGLAQTKVWRHTFSSRETPPALN